LGKREEVLKSLEKHNVQFALNSKLAGMQKRIDVLAKQLAEAKTAK
jgi:hypothetical protein